MRKLFGRLALIALFVFAGVTLWYGRVEKKLQGSISVEQKAPAALPVQKPSEPAPAKNEYASIMARNIFKAAPESGGKPAGEQSQTDLEDLAETKMRLVLLGTVSGSKDDARAIIRDEKAKVEDIYHVGSELHGALITRIGRGKVVLQVNGREEILTIREPESGGPQQDFSPTAETRTPEMRAESASEQRVPEALPRRRISFRNPSPADSAPASTSAPVPAAGPVPQEDNRLAPEEEAPTPGNVEDGAAGQKAQ